MPVEAKPMVGYVSASKKSPVRRWPSRLASLVLIDLGRGGHGAVKRVLTGDEGGVEVLEGALDLADHDVTDAEADGAVRLVDGPGAGLVAGDVRDCRVAHAVSLNCGRMKCRPRVHASA